MNTSALAVKNALIKADLETPMQTNGLSREHKLDKIATLMSQVMNTLELDLNDDSLSETPARIAKMYVDEIFAGLDYGQFPKLATIDNKMGVDEMVKVKNIELTSTCEHHFVVIDGSATVAYIPDRQVIGLSKINRIVRFFAQRPQVQERLTRQILVALQTLLGTQDVAVSIEATHYCVKSRGVQDTNSSTQSTALGGVFKSDARTRAEFFA